MVPGRFLDGRQSYVRRGWSEMHSTPPHIFLLSTSILIITDMENKLKAEQKYLVATINPQS